MSQLLRTFLIRSLLTSEINFVIFLRKFFFRKKNNEFSSWRFPSISWNCQWRADFWSVCVFFNTSIGRHRGSDAGCCRVKPRCRPLFHVFLGTRDHVLILTTKFPIYSKKIYGFSVIGFFFKIYTLSDVAETNCFFSIF